MQGGEVGTRENRRRNEPSLLPKVHGHGSCYRFHCGLRRSGRRKETAKQKGKAAKPKQNHTCSQEDGGKKPGGWGGRSPALRWYWSQPKTPWKTLNKKKKSIKKGKNAPPSARKPRKHFTKPREKKKKSADGQQKEVAGDFGVIGEGVMER